MYNGYVVNAIVQARMTSTRLPGKVLLPLAGKPALQHIIERLRRSKYIDDVVIACTTNEADEPIISLCDSLECKYYRGSEEDVLTRVLEASKAFDTDIIVEITADCPCIDSDVADMQIKNLVDNECEYASNVIERTYPRGFDVQAFWTHVLERVDKEVDNDVDRQHVSSWIYLNPKSRYKKISNTFKVDCSNIRLTLDTYDDYVLLKLVFDSFDINDFGILNIIKLFESYPELHKINAHIPQKSYYQELVKAYG